MNRQTALVHFFTIITQKKTYLINLNTRERQSITKIDIKHHFVLKSISMRLYSHFYEYGILFQIVSHMQTLIYILH